MVEANLERDAIHFLHREAELLDGRSFSQWLEMISPDISYKIPVRTQRLNGEGDGFSKTAFFMREDFLTLKVRVAKLASPSAWAENPATRTRHMVSNIRVGEADVAGLPVNSNFATFCYRGEATVPVILSGERQDLLVRTDRNWKLRKRLVLLDSTVLGLEALSIFL